MPRDQPRAMHGGRQRDTERAGRRGKQYVTDRGDPARLGARKGRDAVAARNTQANMSMSWALAQNCREPSLLIILIH